MMVDRKSGRVRRQVMVAAASLALGLVASQAQAQKKYDPGASDKEILVGTIMPLSGPASAYASIGKSAGAYFDKINAEGGVNGRKIRQIMLDDGYNPAKTVEQARKLVEQDEVLLLFNTLGTPTNSSIHKYMNQKKVPHLFVATGASKWGDPKNYPWTMGWQPNYYSEAKIYASHLLETKPNGKVGILWQNDDYGRDYLKGFKEGLGDKAKSMIVAELSYEVTDPTIDSQMVSLKSSGADVFLNITTPKFAAQAIKKAADIGWKPNPHYLNAVSNSVGSVLVPAGPENGVGILSASYMKDPTDPQWASTKEFKDWNEWMQKYNTGADFKDVFNVFGYSAAQTLVQVLKQAGDNLTRENIMKQAASLDMTLPMLVPGLNVKTGPDDFYPIEKERLIRFNGKTWDLQDKIYGN